ncbi:NAD(P)-dependent oxidoreductase [Streptomyces vinaceus]|uniref:NAD(P)-dependent oxidoreductase n=1 Tax=Streptomyces vinaceus TaxID=1960 RepID=UPI00367EB52E
MKLTVFGATGGVGREVVRQALDAGHEVTAVVRDPARLGVPAHERLEVAVVRDLTDEDALLPVLAGRSAVISALGSASNKQARLSPVTGPGGRGGGGGGGRAGGGRPPGGGGAPGGPGGGGDRCLAPRVFLPLLRRALRDLYADLAVMEATIRASGTEWTVIRPPRLLDKPRSGTYRRVIGANVPDGRTISRADVADALLTSLTDPSTAGRAVGVAA